MDEFSELLSINDEMIPDISISDILQFMQNSLPYDERGSLPGLLFMSLELIEVENQDTVSLVLTARKYSIPSE